MKYRFPNGDTIELHYKPTGATLFDSYDKASLAKLGKMIGMKVLSAYDVEYIDTPNGKRYLKVMCSANAPWEFDFMESKGHLFTVVDVLEDEEKPKEIAPNPNRLITRKELEAEEKAEAEFDRMIKEAEGW